MVSYRGVSGMIPALQSALESRRSLDDTVRVTYDNRHITVNSSETSYRVDKKSPTKVQISEGNKRKRSIRHPLGNGGNGGWRDLDQRVFASHQKGLVETRPREFMIKYLTDFLEERSYHVDKVTRQDLNERKLWIDGKSLDVHFEQKKSSWDVAVKDSDQPFVISPGYQLIFHFGNTYNLKKKGGIWEVDPKSLPIKSHDEEPITQANNSFKRFQNWILYGGDDRLKLFYGNQGRVNPMKHFVKSSWQTGLANGIIAATSLRRVAKRLQGQSYYMSAALALAGIGGIWSEWKYTRKAIEIADHMPDSRQARISQQEEYKAVYELRGVRSWRNFERGILLQERNLVNVYRNTKPNIYRLVGEDKLSKIPEALGIDSSDPKYAELMPLIPNLRPIEIGEIVSLEMQRLHEIADATDEEGKPLDLLMDSEVPELMEYAENVYPRRITGIFYMDANKELADKIRHAVRPPDQEEIERVIEISGSFYTSAAWKMYSTYAMTQMAGLTAAYGDDIIGTGFPGAEIPDEAFLGYYGLWGFWVTYSMHNMLRVQTVMDLQGIIKELERDPRLNAMDTFTQYQSHLNKLFLGSNMVGALIGLGASIFSDVVSLHPSSQILQDIPIFAVEGPATYLRTIGHVNRLRAIKGLNNLYSEPNENNT